MVSVIVVTFNNLEYTRRCLSSLEIHRTLPFQLIVVDNASKDDTPDFLRHYAASRDYVTILLNEKNIGFGEANNLGVAEAVGEDICFLNNDVLVTKSWLEGLIACQRHRSGVGAVGPRSNYVGGPQIVLDTPYRDEAGLGRFADELRERNRGRYQECWRLVGFCLLVPRKALDEIGLFDPIFTIGNYEDTDLCLRLVKAGYRNYFAEDVFIHHFGNKSFETNNVDQDSWLIRNGKVFREKWRSLSGACPYVDNALAYVDYQETQFFGRTTLSAFILAKDAEHAIKEAIANLKPFTDQIIVADYGSSDSTRSIAIAEKVELADIAWEEDYSKARNQALNSTRSDWVIYLEPEERISPIDQARIIALINKKDMTERYCGFRLLQRCYTNDLSLFGFQKTRGSYREEHDYTGYIDIPITRLFKRKANIYFKNKANESVEESIGVFGGKIGQIDIPIHYYGIDRLLERFYFRFNLMTLERARNNIEEAQKQLGHAAALAKADHELELVEIAAKNLKIVLP